MKPIGVAGSKTEIGAPMNIDAGSNLAAFATMDGACAGSIEIAQHSGGESEMAFVASRWQFSGPERSLSLRLGSQLAAHAIASREESHV